ncbi:hypothetical protein [Cupriavidus pinatubonensis]|uniref:hypothetical protein n=1 Tax=Cupriavidus pinatubonensis TaxID=248026 RepID=UPI001CC76B22|nr:hypothetical protein [Cupriavidus pinatubonensis]
MIGETPRTSRDLDVYPIRAVGNLRLELTDFTHHPSKPVLLMEQTSIVAVKSGEKKFSRVVIIVTFWRAKHLTNRPMR